MLPENSNPAEQPIHPALRLIAARPDIFSHQGHIVATYRRKADATLGSEKVYGPYYHLNYREDGRQRAVYFGTAATVVEAVRKALAQMQQPLAQRRLFNAIFSEVRNIAFLAVHSITSSNWQAGDTSQTHISSSVMKRGRCRSFFLGGQNSTLVGG